MAALNVTLLAFAADRRAAAAPDAGSLSNNRSMSPARGAPSSKPTTRCWSG